MTVITHLFIKKVKGHPMVGVNSIGLTAGLGIITDVNANQISPRQILITRKEDLDELEIRYGGLRENIIIDGASTEEFKPGSILIINNKVKIRLTFYCEPCKRIADAVPSMNAVLNRRGILGVIIESGEISIGDRIIIVPDQFKPFSEVPYERFLNFIQFVPPGKVVTYKMVCEGMGVAESYVRAIPKYIEKAINSGLNLPLHRIVDTEGATIESYVPNQQTQLKGENIHIVQSTNLFEQSSLSIVPLSKYLWQGEPLFLQSDQLDEIQV